MGRFGNMLGVKEIDINGDKFEISAKAGDNLRLTKIMSLPESERIDALYPFCVDIMCRNYPSEPKAEIEGYVEFNIMLFVREILIAFGWLTRADWDSKQGEAEKKLMSGD